MRCVQFGAMLVALRVLLQVLPTGVQPISGAQRQARSAICIIFIWPKSKGLSVSSRVWCDVYFLTTHWVPVIETMTAKIGTIDTIAATSWYLPNCWRPVAMKATRGEPNTAHKRHGARSTMWAQQKCLCSHVMICWCLLRSITMRARFP